MDPFAFLNDRLEELPGVGSSVLERLKSLDIGGGAFLPDPFSADLGSLFASKSAVPDVGAPQGFVTPMQNIMQGKNMGTKVRNRIKKFMAVIHVLIEKYKKHN
jgi:hypothetical protein